MPEGESLYHYRKRMGLCTYCGVRDPKHTAMCAICLKDHLTTYRESKARSTWLAKQRRLYARALVHHLTEGGPKPEPPRIEDYKPALWSLYRMRRKPKRKKRKYTKRSSQPTFRGDTMVLVEVNKYLARTLPYRRVKPGMQIVGVVDARDSPFWVEPPSPDGHSHPPTT